MKFCKFKFFLISGVLWSATVFAGVPAPAPNVDVVPLARIVNDRNSNVSYLNLMVSRDDAVRGIYVQGHGSAEGRGNGAFWLRDIQGEKGVVLRKAQGRKVISLRGTIDSRAGKGSLVITYLHNGLLMSYSRCKLGIRKSGRRDWKLINAYNGNEVTDIEIKTWWLGIATLASVCPATA